jgi:hypothetical protein
MRGGKELVFASQAQVFVRFPDLYLYVLTKQRYIYQCKA